MIRFLQEDKILLAEILFQLLINFRKESHLLEIGGHFLYVSRRIWRWMATLLLIHWHLFYTKLIQINICIYIQISFINLNSENTEVIKCIYVRYIVKISSLIIFYYYYYFIMLKCMSIETRGQLQS